MYHTLQHEIKEALQGTTWNVNKYSGNYYEFENDGIRFTVYGTHMGEIEENVTSFQMFSKETAAPAVVAAMDNLANAIHKYISKMASTGRKCIVKEVRTSIYVVYADEELDVENAKYVAEQNYLFRHEHGLNPVSVDTQISVEVENR